MVVVFVVVVAMASSQHNSAQPDPNPYFDPSITQQTPDLAASRSAPQGSAAATSAANPTTPGREQPPIISRPRPNFNGANTANRQQSSIGLRRLKAPRSRAGMTPVANDFEQSNPQPQPIPQGQNGHDGRRRSSSEPQRPNWSSEGSGAHALKPLPSVPELSANGADKAGSTSGASSRRAWLPRWGSKQPAAPQLTKEEKEAIAQEAEYDHRIVDLLDVVDPEVSTLTSITNLQNSLFIPSLGRFVNRRPTYDLSWAPPARRNSNVPGAYPDSLENINEEPRQQPEETQRPAPNRTYSITSNVESTHYAALPHGASLEGWDPEDVARLDDHVRHMLHSRRSKLARSWKGFIRYASRPLGFLVTLYATLITLFGLAWVLFLIGWIEVGSKQNYLVEIIDYTLVALFAIVGDGLAPFRAVDTYHMIYIAHYRKFSSYRDVSNIFLTK